LYFYKKTEKLEVKKYKTIKESETILTELMIPSYANFGGKVHGGVLLSLMDKVAYVTASKHCGSYCVTVAVEGVEFLSPVEVGELVSLKSSVNFVGNSTMIIGMRVEALNPKTDKTKHTNSCYFTMAAKNENGELAEVPGLIIENELQLRRYVEANELKKMSLKKRQMLQSDFDHKTVSELKLEFRHSKCKINF
jgi:acyl-CoA hydrolase